MWHVELISHAISFAIILGLLFHIYQLTLTLTLGTGHSKSSYDTCKRRNVDTNNALIKALNDFK